MNHNHYENKATKDWKLKKETTFAFGYFSTTSGHFFTIHICIFHKILVLTVILRGWTYLNPNGIKIYDINYKMVWQVCFLYLEEKKWKFKIQKWPFFDHLWSFFGNYMAIFHKTEIQTVILRCLLGLNLNWINSYDVISG